METLLHQEVRQSVWQSVTLVLQFVVHHFQRDSAPTFSPDSPPEIWSCICSPAFSVFKPPPTIGAGGGYMFSGRPTVPLSVRPLVRPSE